MKPPPAGYSGTPLPAKLGPKSGMGVLALNAPANLDALLARAPDVERLTRAGSFDCALALAKTRGALGAMFARLEPKLPDHGMIGVAWPKKTSGVATDLTENLVRRMGLAARLVDVKVAAIDATWSGLKFVRRLRDRRT